MIRTATRGLAAVLFSATLAVTPTSSHARSGHRATIKAKPVATGLNGPSGFTFAPNGVIWYLERGTGEVHTLDPRTAKNHRVFTINGVNGDGERGALGIALSPRWPSKKVVYVYATRNGGGHLQNQLVRFAVSGGRGHGLKVLLTSPASASPYHNGGRILFGPDRKLYVMIGDGHDSTNAQDRSGNFRGKILRLDPDGTGAKGNPFGSRIWSYGHRNSFGFTFDPATHRLWETENGPECTDEINLVVKGGNFGWGPKESCSVSTPRGTNNSGPTPHHGPKWFTGLDDRDHRRGVLPRLRDPVARAAARLRQRQQRVTPCDPPERRPHRVLIEGAGDRDGPQRRPLGRGLADRPHLLQRHERDLPPDRCVIDLRPPPGPGAALAPCWNVGYAG